LGEGRGSQKKGRQEKECLLHFNVTR
jgi:hypothetical protein